MLDPRIYRTGLIVTALALVVLAFSLRDQPAALSPTIAPDAFNGQNVFNNMSLIAATDPDRRPGSSGDRQLAGAVYGKLKQFQFAPTIDRFPGRTVDGTRTLEDVVGMRPGVRSGSIVVLASRDALGSGAVAAASGTAMLMELARDLEGETLNHSVVLASTSGTQGTAGAIHLAASLSGPVDAVLVLGDVASAHVSQPIVIPWAQSHVVAPPVLRNTVAAAIAGQTSLSDAFTSLGGQFAHLAFPYSLGQQAPFGAQGIPAVEISLSGEAGPRANAAPSGSDQINGIGRAVLTTISALDAAPSLPAPSSYLLLGGKVVPGWAMTLFVLALLVPVVMTTIDGIARAKRRGYVIWRGLVLVLAAAVPFLLGLGVILAAGFVGLIPIAPPGPVAAGAIPLDGGGLVTIVLACLIAAAAAAGVWVLWRLMGGRRAAPEAAPPVLPAPAAARAAAARRRSTRAERPTGAAGLAGLLLVMCVITFVIWLGNPYAALLLIPALHLWLWAASPDLRIPLAVRGLLIVVGLAPVALIVVYYAGALHYTPAGVLWQAVLLLAGHGVSLVAAAEWAVVLGCLVSAATLSLRAARGQRVVVAPITVRGPASYAGPGSLGGTKSAMRR